MLKNFSENFVKIQMPKISIQLDTKQMSPLFLSDDIHNPI